MKSTATDSASGTRRALLDRGRTLFAQYGYEALTTRHLARECGVNLAAVNYHFGGKEGLYLAVIDEIVEDLGRSVCRRLEELRAGIAASAGNRRALGVLASEFVSHLVRGAVGNPDNLPAARIIQQEFSRQSPAFARLFEEFVLPLHLAAFELARAARPDKSDGECKVLGHALIGMCLSFITGQNTATNFLGAENYSPERVELITATLAASAPALLGLPSPQPHAE